MSKESIKEWPALGQSSSRRKLNPKANSFAAAVKVQHAEVGEGKSNSIAEPTRSLDSQQSECSWEEKKAAIRAAKLAQKEEKRIKREENARRKLFAPKGYLCILKKKSQ